ncbi:(d)CMP kinase [Prolixibacteraceae bacterium JC049]|nr:(d)CMP kinase [Prolixibacteraceae bacterium JC049]
MSENKKITIAIDGHSSCGKSTVAKDLAKELSYSYIDTGAMYRAVTLFGLRNGLIENGKVDEQKLVNQLPNIIIRFQYNAEEKKNETFLNGERVEDEIRELTVSNNVSPVATIREVREAMVKLQQEMGREKGIVMDGRDIGTVVFPDAELKLFMTASDQVRAQRRFDELSGKGSDATFEEVIQNIRERDHIDSTRKESPLRQADDAVVLDNSNLTPDEQLTWVIEKVNKILEQIQ